VALLYPLKQAFDRLGLVARRLEIRMELESLAHGEAPLPPSL